jgi:hypothetical protein
VGPNRDPVAENLNKVSVDGDANPPSVQPNDAIVFHAKGFKPGEKVDLLVIPPIGRTDNLKPSTLKSPAGQDGSVVTNLPSVPQNMVTGLWTMVFTGGESQHESIVYFVVTPPTGPEACDVGPAKDDRAIPSSIKQSNTIVFTAGGFKANEAISWWFTKAGESQPVLGSVQPEAVFQREEDGKVVPWVGQDGSIRVSQNLFDPKLAPGSWVLSMQGTESKKLTTIQFCIVK